MTRETISTKNAPGAIGPYSQAIATESFVFCSGQVGLDPGSGELVGGLEAQTQRALENLKGVLEAAGTTLNSVVKTTVFLTSMDDFAPMNAVYEGFFPKTPPARSTVAVRELPKGAMFEVEAIAVR